MSWLFLCRCLRRSLCDGHHLNNPRRLCRFAHFSVGAKRARNERGDRWRVDYGRCVVSRLRVRLRLLLPFLCLGHRQPMRCAFRQQTRRRRSAVAIEAPDPLRESPSEHT